MMVYMNRTSSPPAGNSRLRVGRREVRLSQLARVDRNFESLYHITRTLDSLDSLGHRIEWTGICGSNKWQLLKKNEEISLCSRIPKEYVDQDLYINLDVDCEKCI